MAIRTVVTRGFGNGTFTGTIGLVTRRGYGSQEIVVLQSTRLVLIGPSKERLLLVGPSLERLTVEGASTERLSIEGRA